MVHNFTAIRQISRVSRNQTIMAIFFANFTFLI
jgi:hypothetical protein